MEVINWKIFTHPVNWLILFLMVFIAGIALHFILTHLNGGQTPSKTTT